MRILVLSILLLIANFTYAADCSVEKLQPSLQIMAQRAQLMYQVAAYKYTHNLPIYDSDQELTILQHVDSIAKKEGFNSQSLLAFAQMQMDMSKHIENYWIHYWETHPANRPNPHHIDSLMSIRLNLLNIGHKLYPAIKTALPAYHYCSMQQLRPAFNRNFYKIEGIPHNPDYAMMYLWALKNIKMEE